MRVFLFLISVSLLFALHGQSAEARQGFEGVLLELRDKESYKEVVRKVDSTLENELSAENKSMLFHRKAEAYYFLNDLNASLEYFTKAVELLSEYLRDTVELIEVYSHAGFCNKYLGKYLEALPYYEKALDIAKAAKDSIEISTQLYSLGSTYLSLSRYDQSRQFLEQAYELDFMRKDTIALGYDLAILGDLMLKLEDPAAAINYYKKAVKIKKTFANNVNTGVLRYGKLAKAYLAAGVLDSARYFNTKAVRMAEENGDSLSLAKQWIDLAEIQLATGNVDSAEKVARLGYQYFKKHESDAFLISMGKVLIDVLEQKRYYELANRLADEVIVRAAKGQMPENLRDLYLTKSIILEKLGEHQEALKYYKAHETIQDSLSQSKQLVTSLILQREYETATNEIQIEKLTLEGQLKDVTLKQSKTLQLATFITSGLIISIFVVYFVQRNKKLKAEKEAHQLQVEALQKRLLDLNLNPFDKSLDFGKLNDHLKSPLTEREFEVLELTIQEQTNADIGDRLFIGIKTVKFHLSNIYKKLGVSNRKEALAFVNRNG